MTSGEKESSKTLRLEYRLPWITFTAAFIAFFLLNYLALCMTTNEDGTDILLSPHVAAVKLQISTSIGNEDFPFDPYLFLEDTVMRALFRLSRKFGGMNAVQIIWCLAWVAHCLELGIAVRICTSCKAAPGVFAAYIVMILMGGLTQLVPLIDARDKYVSLLAESQGNVESNEQKANQRDEKKRK